MTDIPNLIERLHEMAGGNEASYPAQAAAALEELQKYVAALEENKSLLDAFNAAITKRAELAEQQLRECMAHADAMAARIEWYAEEGWVNGDIPEARRFRQWRASHDK